MIGQGFSYGVAHSLPLAQMWSELRLAEHRVNQAHQTTAVLTRAAIVDVLATGNHLQDALEALNERE